ncbi:MAG: DUF1858 domain-containing protein [Anaerovoracaceae bacterium]
MKITKDIIVNDLLEEYPELEDVLADFGMTCVGCPGATMESLADAAEGHGIELDEIIDKLNLELKNL